MKLIVITASLVVCTSVLPAQDIPRNCNLEFPNTPSTRLNLQKLESGKYNTYSGGGIVAHCIGQGNTLR
ncbi:MAG TPA: hypothetical protein VGO75_13570, partial [Gemmatimonadaceae bacterium]|nr:hypothetical protein [Gemmatimonadaceae bacterium]